MDWKDGLDSDKLKRMTDVELQDLLTVCKKAYEDGLDRMGGSGFGIPKYQFIALDFVNEEIASRKPVSNLFLGLAAAIVRTGDTVILKFKKEDWAPGIWAGSETALLEVSGLGPCKVEEVDLLGRQVVLSVSETLLKNLFEIKFRKPE